MPSNSTRNITLYFVRHGESVGNVEKSIPAPDNDILTEKGKEQAQKLGNKLAGEGVLFTRVYSSDYSRTMETVSLILNNQRQFVPAESIKKDIRIREQNAGIFEGKTYQDVLIDVITSKVPVLEHTVPGGETREDIYKRLDSFLEETFTDLVSENTTVDQNVLIVSHAFCLHHLMSYLKKSDKFFLVNWKDDCKKLMWNTSYTKMQLSQLDDAGSLGKWKLELLDIQQKSHLGEDGVLEAQKKNESLKKFMDTLGPAGEGLSGCIQA